MAHRPDSLVIRRRVADQTALRKDMFIEALKHLHNVSVVCEVIKVSRAIVYQWKKEDPFFSERWDEAKQFSKEALESATYLKAMRGTSPAAITASIFLLKGMYPEKYAERYNVKSTNVHVAIDWDNLPEQVIDDFIAGKLTTQDVYDVQLRLRSASNRSHTTSESEESTTTQE